MSFFYIFQFLIFLISISIAVKRNNYYACFKKIFSDTTSFYVSNNYFEIVKKSLDLLRKYNLLSLYL